jgi:hypothetical protein
MQMIILVVNTRRCAGRVGQIAAEASAPGAVNHYCGA